jgi:ADP-ribosylglycohydrolase
MSILLGAALGDIIGSRFEWDNYKGSDFELLHPACKFTDDSVLTFALAEALLRDQPYGAALHRYGRAYQGRGYGGNFRRWLASDDPQPYRSYGNGSAMRVSPMGWAFDTLEATLEAARDSALPSHGHPEGIKGAQAVAAAIFLARNGSAKAEISTYLSETFGYELDRSLDDIRPDYRFDVTCQGSVPQAIRAFLESHDYESSIRLAISIGGDSDTIACITGSIAFAAYGHIAPELIAFAGGILDDHLLGIAQEFDARYGPS